MTAEEILGDYKFFIAELLKRAVDLKIDLDNFPIDHLCYRVVTLGEYEQMKEKMLTMSSAYAENSHNGRPIAKFLLKEPLVFDKYSIPLVELPAPKEGAAYSSGLEHLEMAVGEGFNGFVAQHQGSWTGEAEEGSINQTVYITFGSGETIKFHKNSLLDVLKEEGQPFLPI